MRKRQRWKYSLPFLGIILIALLSACSSTATATTSGTSQTSATAPTPTPTSAGGTQTLQFLVKTVQAMQQVKSLHVDATSQGTFQLSGGTSPTLNQATPYTLKLNSDIAVTSQQEQGQLRLVLGAQGQNQATVKAREIVSGNKLYYKATLPVQDNQQTATQKWAVVDLAQAVNQQQIAASTIQAQNLLMLLTQHVAIADRGEAQVKGVQTRHLTVTLTQQDLAQIAANTTQPMVRQALSSIQLKTPLQMDIFINEGTSRLQQVQVKSQMAINIDQALGRMQQSGTGTQVGTLQVSTTTTVNFSKYDQPVKITVPTTTATNVQLQQ